MVGEVVITYKAGDATPAAARRGAALVLRELSTSLTEADVSMAVDFLLNRGLADPDEGIRYGMGGAVLVPYACCGVMAKLPSSGALVVRFAGLVERCRRGVYAQLR